MNKPEIWKFKPASFSLSFWFPLSFPIFIPFSIPISIFLHSFSFIWLIPANQQDKIKSLDDWTKNLDLCILPRESLRLLPLQCLLWDTPLDEATILANSKNWDLGRFCAVKYGKQLQMMKNQTYNIIHREKWGGIWQKIKIHWFFWWPQVGKMDEYSPLLPPPSSFFLLKDALLFPVFPKWVSLFWNKDKKWGTLFSKIEKSFG